MYKEFQKFIDFYQNCDEANILSSVLSNNTNNSPSTKIIDDCQSSIQDESVCSQ